MLPDAVRAACLLCTVTCVLKATGKARCRSCVGAKSLSDSGGVLPAVAAAKPLVGAPWWHSTGVFGSVLGTMV